MTMVMNQCSHDDESGGYGVDEQNKTRAEQEPTSRKSSFGEKTIRLVSHRRLYKGKVGNTGLWHVPEAQHSATRLIFVARALTPKIALST